MLQLKGKNLGERQKELNVEVLKATSKNVDFCSIASLDELSDVDRLYKIDVAAEYKNVDYIIETLKSGDSLYISRALKCAWLYENNSTYNINPDFLHHKVFPFMSTKMKKKMLTTISMHVRDENKAEEFYKYCLTDIKLNTIAMKFLTWTSEQHKIKYICGSNVNIDILKLKHFIGQSFDLAEVYLEKKRKQELYTNEDVHEFRYLFKISNEKYLDLMEKYTTLDGNVYYLRIPQLGLRFSKQIVTKHKKRVLNNINLYFKKLNIDIIVRYSSVEDVKQYAVRLLPPNASTFWGIDFYGSYKKIFNLLPQNEIYSFLRQIFLSHYSREPFEMCKNFYTLKYYETLSYEEREVWALEHLRQKNELLGPDQDYHWYEFVNFNLAFKEIKKYISASTDEHKRADMISVLLKSVRNEEQLEIVISHYYDRHVNEKEDFKLKFIDDVIDQHNFFIFGEKCWDALFKLLHSTNVLLTANFWHYNKFKTIVILYCIIHDKAIPNVLENYIISNDNVSNIPPLLELRKKLTDDQIELIYKHLINLCSNKMRLFDVMSYDAIKDKAWKIIHIILQVMRKFEKTKDDCPDIALKYIKLDWENYKSHDYFAIAEDQLTEGKLLRLLKQDPNLLVDTLPNLPDKYRLTNFNNLLKKIRVYFSNDVAKDWLGCCEKLILEKSGYETSLFKTIIMSIFHIASDDYKISFLSKYVPKEPKISYDKIDRKLLTIQEGICRFAHYSRPPVPLTAILPYIKGDYVHFCLPMFNSYLVNLPIPQCLTFISAILNTPVSIQKHGIRLAFESFSTENLTNLIVNVWKTTKNVSLRMTIYKALFDKLTSVDPDSQLKLYEVLKRLTLDLLESDDDSVFALLTSFHITKYKGDFLETAWNAVRKLPDQPSKNIQRKHAVVCKIDSEISIMDKQFCRTHILDQFIGSMLNDNNIGQVCSNNYMEKLINAKWKLAAKYIIYNDQIERSIELVHIIVHKCIEMWNTTDNGTYTLQKFMFWFIEEILDYSYHKCDKSDSVPVLEYILKLLSELRPITEFYSLYLKLNLIIISKRIMGPNECNYVNLTPKNVADKLSTEVLVFLNEHSSKNLLFASFYETIGSLLRYSVEMMTYSTHLDCVAIVTLVSANFIEAAGPAAQLLSLIILPRERRKDYTDIWLTVIQKVRASSNLEVTAYYYKHFVQRDFKEF